MDINYGVLLYSAVGFILTVSVFSLIKWTLLRVIKGYTSKETKKELKKAFKPIFTIAFAGWLLFALIAFGMNPMIHNQKQTTVGTDVLMEEAIIQSEVNMNQVKEEGIRKIKNKEKEVHDELKEKDKESADEYNNFLKSIN